MDGALASHGVPVRLNAVFTHITARRIAQPPIGDLCQHLIFYRSLVSRAAMKASAAMAVMAAVRGAEPPVERCIRAQLAERFSRRVLKGRSRETDNGCRSRSSERARG